MVDGPPIDDFLHALDVAEVPAIYENALDHGNAEAARQKVEQHIKQKGYEGITILRAGNTTAVVVYDEETHSAAIAFDPTKSFFSKDGLDNVKRGEKHHSIGGQVHGGLLSDLVRPNTQPMDTNLVDGIGGVLQSHAYEQELTLSVTFTGFSKGGAQTVLASAELMADNFFQSNPDIRLDNVYTFASLAYGDKKFQEKFEECSDEAGTNLWRIELKGDKTPSIFTSNGQFLRAYNYGHVGERVVITPENNSNFQLHSIGAYREGLEILQEKEPSPSQSVSPQYQPF